ncbi:MULTISPECIES: NACHT domain-containing protein [Legionella]|uniref:NACHT domain-containing protein n=1 Tax=Legionella TaxID=445 RepID=UPI00095D3CF9|nr:MULTISPECIES: ATP-binding protein [Legionella]MBN9225698.1 ATP-binding protein [Legionella steelei]OJW12249.1 MAG: hypothetical protein BGO44_07225 [Legionella sp. 39-23]
MSISGIRSNRGDGYQTFVAFDWALTVLSDPDFQWIEVDSATYTLVDDVVVGKTDGTKICCQCKKNQTNFKVWKIADFEDELVKASSLLAGNKNAEVRFYSRSPFGALAKLREHSTTQPNEISYRASLSKEDKKIDADLALLFSNQTIHLSTYDFLRRTTFETSPDLDRMEIILFERLRYMACNPQVAYNALWTRLDQLGARIDGNKVLALGQHRLTKDDLKAVLHQAGAILVPIMNLVEVRRSFASTSAIGRIWRRDIAGQCITTPVLNELIAAIDSGKRTILLQGPAGSGKTCVMLALQESLEQRARTSTDIVPLFIQSREFADLTTTQDRQAQGLPEQWVEKAARIAEDVRVVVVIDSLDVLSIARDHHALNYFLAQIDRLLLIPNITVVTACRDFDRDYDRRIAIRKWDCELKCHPLNWDVQITPLLNNLGIHTKNIDANTHELIRNPRELALFVELAQRDGSFNIVTSQALAQRYLDIIVRANKALGDTAMQTIEAIAKEMLMSRSLVVPYQCFTASQDIVQALCSLNVLQETQDGKLTFGHQTLLDVLVIRGAVRKGILLNEFIESLPPVPFVRPSIRSFVAQLAVGERRDFRKQLRMVLTGSAAFHIRRLIAESFAEQIPQDDDWPLIRDLRDNHREVFQVIYSQAVLIEWHRFWLKHLIPALKSSRDDEGLTAHAHRISLWKNEDPVGVLALWTEMLSMDWVDGKKISEHLGYYLSEINTENIALAAPLIERLISMPRQEHDLLGHAVARCVATGALKDIWLWRYITCGVNEDAIGFQSDDRLRCQSHKFENNNDSFFRYRMEQSATLLDLALEWIEHESQSKSLRYGNTRIDYHSQFLYKTSYYDSHSQSDHRYTDSERILLDAVESAIINHAKTHSDWWQRNREHLCFNNEGALRYFAILACTADPVANINLIGRMLCDRGSLESELSFELGTLMQTAFIYFDTLTQDAVMACILAIWEGTLTDEGSHFWILKKRAELIITIPCHLRSAGAQAILDTYEREEGILVRQPFIGMSGGMVSAPFSFKVFLDSSDCGVLRLLEHYSGHGRDDLLVGGEREVGWQLREAASRQPARFLSLLPTRWADIPEGFRDDIMGGIANYLLYRFGSLQANSTWAPLDEPDAPTLAIHILDELERHSNHWENNNTASKAVQSCAHVIQDTQNASRLVFLVIGFSGHREESCIKGDFFDLLTTGLNMTRGNIAQALIVLVNKLQENSVPFPDLLLPTLRRFAGDEHPAIRALILNHLPYLQSKNPELGWDLFHFAMRNAVGLWQIAEPCLYYAHYKHFGKIAPLLLRIRSEGNDKDMETWARISALAALAKHIDFSALLEDLKTLDATEAWKGAASVWTHHENLKKHREQCLIGIETGLNSNWSHAKAISHQMVQLFCENLSVISIPIELIRLLFAIYESDTENKRPSFLGLGSWLNATAHLDPERALTVTEIYLVYVSRTKSYLYDHENNLTQLLTRLFAEAEEREESDHGAMLKRVVLLQDMLLSLGVNSINDWLKAAERP